MKKQLLMSIGLCSGLFLQAQMKDQAENDTLKIQEIEDVQLHKTGNPNAAKVFSTKSNIPTIENPQAISIVTHEMIEQQQAKQLSEVVKNVNGIYLTSARGSSQESFGGRGFTFGNENIFKNGAKVNSGIFPEVSGLERVEVLKGSNAMLYGNVAPGGIVNLITKKPRFSFGGSLGMNIGSWNSYKPLLDFYGPLSEKMAFRVNGTYEYADSFRDRVHSEKHYFNPSLVFNIGQKTQMIWEADYLYHHFTPDFGIGSLTDAVSQVSFLNTGLSNNKFLGTDWQYQTNQMATTDVILNHEINTNWSINSVVSFQNYTKDYFSTERIQWIYNSLKQPDRSWLRPLNKTYNEQNYASVQLNVNGNFMTRKVKHSLLIGTDGDYGSADSYTFLNPENGKEFGRNYFYGTNGNSNGLVFLDDENSWASGTIPQSEKKARRRINTNRFGWYAQDFIEISKKFKMIAGIRYSYLENKDTLEKTFSTQSENPLPNTGTKDSAISPKLGIIYTPNLNFTIYGTYTNSFVPNSGFTISGDALQPSIVDQYEVGVKKNIIKNTVALNFNLYQIDNRNTYTTARYKADGTENADSTIKEFAGKVQSRGFEIDLTGNPTSQISLIGGFSFNHSVYTSTPAEYGFVENQRIVRTPAITANASAFYKFDKNWKGVLIGGSLYYTGERKAGWNDTKNQSQVTRMIDVKGFTTVDLSFGYEMKKILLQAKIGNVFDVENYNIHENYSVNPITPRNFYFTLTYKL